MNSLYRQTVVLNNPSNNNSRNALVSVCISLFILRLFYIIIPYFYDKGFIHHKLTDLVFYYLLCFHLKWPKCFEGVKLLM